MELSFKQTHNVRADETAARLGSGRLEVYSTPSLAALIENTAMRCMQEHYPDAGYSVGCRLCIDHTKPSSVGETLTAEARIVGREGRTVNLAVTVTDSHEQTVGTCEHTRVIIDPERFMSKIRK